MLHATLCLTLATAIPTAAPTRYTIQTEEVGSIRAVLTFSVTYPNLRATEWVWFAADAPELPGQTAVKTTLQPAGTASRDLSPLARPVVLVRVPVETDERRTTLPMKVVYEATLHSRTLKPLGHGVVPPAVPDLSEADRQMLLAEHGDVAFKRESFQKWLKDQHFVRKTNESDVELARRVFLGIRATFKYAYESNMDRTAPAVCQAGKSDCGGLSALFVAVMRANGIPARALYGRWAMSAKPNQTIGEMAYYQWHAKAEFFAAGVGWVPVDMAGGIVHDQSEEGLRYFGRDRGDFLTFHTDTDLILDTQIFGKQTIHNLQQPAWWVRGLGTLEPTMITEGWVVEKK
jgi:transglutaminase-like putative cysteine protease